MFWRMSNRVLDHFDIVDRGILILPWKSRIYCIFFEVVDVTFVLLKPLWRPKACASWATTKGVAANTAITAAIVTILKAIPVFEFISICYEYLIINMMTNSICEYHLWYLSSTFYASGKKGEWDGDQISCLKNIIASIAMWRWGLMSESRSASNVVSLHGMNR